MNEALKTLEDLMKFAQQQVDALANNNSMPDASFDLLRKASLLLIEAEDALRTARAWNHKGN